MFCPKGDAHDNESGMPIVTDYTALLSGIHWCGREVYARPHFLTYSFPTAVSPGHDAPDVMGAGVSTFQAFDAADQQRARQALAEWADACGLLLFEVSAERGDITFSWYDFTGSNFAGAAGFAFFPGSAWSSFSDPYYFAHGPVAGDVFVELAYAEGGLPSYDLLLHEIGHALGLKHPFEAFGTHTETLDPMLDNKSNTVMSYTGPPATQLGPLDIAAAVAIYGAAGSDGSQVASWSWNAAQETLTQAGSGASDTIQGVSVEDSISGRGGDDLLLGIEGDDTLRGGGGQDLLLGGPGKDVLMGEGGNDTIDGGEGKDRIKGGQGNDLLYGGSGQDRFLFGPGFGQDSIGDFADGSDLIDLSRVPAIEDMGDISLASGGPTVVVVTVGTEGLIILFGVTLAQITALDFIF
jgi:hypothetical protein